MKSNNKIRTQQKQTTNEQTKPNAYMYGTYVQHQKKPGKLAYLAWLAAKRQAIDLGKMPMVPSYVLARHIKIKTEAT